MTGRSPRARSSAALRRRTSAVLGDSRGAALFVVLLLSALLLSLGIFGTRAGQMELMIAGNDLAAKRALEVADAGIRHALGLIRQHDVAGANDAADGFDDELSEGGTGGALAALGDAVSVGGESYRFAALYGAGGDGYFVRAADNHDETNGVDDPSRDRDRRIVLVSRGRSGRAERVVQAVVERDPAFACVLCGSLDFAVAPLDVALAGPVSTDSYDSSAAPYDAASAGSAGNVFSNGDVDLKSDPPGLLPIDVRGDVVAARAIAESGGAVNVSGRTRQFADAVDFPPVTPCGPPFPPNAGVSGGSYDQLSGILSNIGPDDVIELAPGEYCFGSISMTGASRLRVSGPVRIHLTAPSVILGVSNATAVPGNLRILSSAVSPAPLPIVPGLSIAGGAGAAMAVYAPRSIVTIAGIGDFYGAVVGGMLPSVGAARLHYDAALANPGVRLVSWREARNYPPD
jgi:hypothetical protein